jgi:hypothetical protein
VHEKPGALRVTLPAANSGNRVVALQLLLTLWWYTKPITIESDQVSRFIFIALLAFLTLFLVPGIGAPLAFFGGIFLVGFLAHVLMLSLVVDVMIKRIGRAWLVVPFGVYGGYYVTYYYQAVLIDRKSVELRASNPGQVITFDPAHYSLVTEDAERLVSNYKIPVVYAIDGGQYPENKGFSSYRLIRKDQCNVRIKNSHAVAGSLDSENVMSKQACLFRIPEAIQSKPLMVVSRGGVDAEWDTRWGFKERVTEMMLDGTVIGSFRTASIWRWSWFPFAVFACYHKGGPSSPLECHGEVFGHAVYISGTSTEDRYSKRAVPEAVMLGLRKYAVADTETFEGSDQGFDFSAVIGKSN